jgi:diacylglycerol kinase (ATP)
MKKFNITARRKSFSAAFRGIAALVRDEHNFRIHIFILMLAVAAGLFFKISPAEWLAVVAVSGLVLTAESLNTALEKLSDKVSPGIDPLIGKAKDAAAAGVLIAAIVALVTGLIIFVPKIIALFS